MPPFAKGAHRGNCPYTPFTNDRRIVTTISAIGIQRTSLIADQILGCAGQQKH
ncbi:hypothetical protein QUB37_15940 [Microcoleus sp. AT3-A2]|uniref:hypothetical protein n=1 Tax=Microcoleus sp. Pol10D4 TaxID=3055387 RepID=UPI002FD26787